MFWQGLISMFSIEFTEQAKQDLKWFRKAEQKIILSGIYENLSYEPSLATRNRKPLRPNSTAIWELRIGEFRVLYNVDKDIQIVSIERIGEKSGNKLLFQGKEISL
jgi:mRNA-degrading endonuclease RelE of RelBE toxin-antitoxin system